MATQVTVVVQETHVPCLTAALDRATQAEKDQLKLALGMGQGNGVGGFRAYNNGVPIGSFTSTPLATFQCPRAGTVRINWGWWGMTTTTQYVIYSAARIKLNDEMLGSCAGIFMRKENIPEGVGALTGASLCRLWVPVKAGDIITGLAEFVGQDRVNGVTAYQANGHGVDGLSVAYVS